MRRPGKHLTVNTHKDRGEWFLTRSTYPLRDAPPVALEKFWDHPDQYAHVHHVQWIQAGPRNYPGRVTSLVIDPRDPKRLYAGAAAGGVWVSHDEGCTWISCWPRLLNQHIGALAAHPTDGNVLICATGEGNLSADSYCGSGVYQTNDGGFTWTLAIIGGVRAALPRRVGSIAFMGLKPSAGYGTFGIVLGAVSNNEQMPAALYIDQGNGILPCLFWGDRNYNCYSVVAHAKRAGLLYAAGEPRGTLNGIWRTEDAGKTWEHLKQGLPRPETCKRISLAISASDPDILYALIGGQDSSVLGVYKTINGGETWHDTAGSHFAKETQLSYNNTIAVHPEDPHFVLCGAVDLHLTRDGGRSWKQATTGQRGMAGQPLPKNFVHSDHHALIVTKEGRLYSGNDGGVAMSEDMGHTWHSRSEGMVTAQFYAADVAQSDSRIFGGGTQDNGTLIAGVPSQAGGPAPHGGNFTRVLPGDGGWIAFDPEDAEHVFGSTADLLFSRHKQGEPWAAGDQLAGWAPVSIDPTLFGEGERQLRAIAVLMIPPRAHGERRAVMAGTNRLWRTIDDGSQWHPISPSFDGSAISAIAASPADPKTILVGTSEGGIYRTRDAGETWTHDIAGPALPRRVITDIEFHPEKRGTVAVSVAATATPGASLASHKGESSYGHVFLSDDWGGLWSDIDNGSLPDVVFNAMAFESHAPYRLFAGGDAGVWMYSETEYRGEKRMLWASIAGSMPNVVVSDLSFHHKDRILTAATYGRGIWRLKVTEPFPVVHGREKDPPSDQPGALGLLCDRTKEAPVLVAPADGAVFNNYPRTTNFSWKAVEGAIGYTVLLDYGENATESFSSHKHEATHEIAGANTATWRVWAIFAGGWRSRGSEARSFRYTV
jgi:photosystem II stability/assembly factor-like uncharacterized protein